MTRTTKTMSPLTRWSTHCLTRSRTCVYKCVSQVLWQEFILTDHQLFESEMRCAIIEADTREEVIQEMEERMHRMEEMYTRRLVKQVCPFLPGRPSPTHLYFQAEQNEMKMDAKIDMLQRSSTLRKAVAAPAEPAQPEEEELSDIDEADEIERSIVRLHISPSVPHILTHSLSASQKALTRTNPTSATSRHRLSPPKASAPRPPRRSPPPSRARSPTPSRRPAGRTTTTRTTPTRAPT